MRWLGVALLLVVALLVALVLWVEFEPAAAPPPPPAASDRPAPTTTEHDRVPRTERPSTDEPMPTAPDEEPTTTEPAITRPVHRILVRTEAGEPVPGFPLRLHGMTPLDGVRQFDVLCFTDTDGVLAAEHAWGSLNRGPIVENVRTGDEQVLVGEETVIVVEAGPAVEARFYDATTGRDVPGGEIRLRGARLECADGGTLHTLAHTGLERGEWSPLLLETEAPDGWALVHLQPTDSGVHVGRGVDVLEFAVPVVRGVSAEVRVELPDGSPVEGARLFSLHPASASRPLNRIFRHNQLPVPVEGAPDLVSDANGRIPLPALIPILNRGLAVSVRLEGRLYESETIRLGVTDELTPVSFRVVVGTNAVAGHGGRFRSRRENPSHTQFAPTTGDESGNATLFVSVRHHDGSPVRHALVYVEGAPAARTDASGQVRLTALPAGSRRVVVMEPGFPITSRDVELNEGEPQSIEIQAPQPQVVRITVRDQVGDPLPGAEVVLRPYGSLPFVRNEGNRQFANAVTDRMGRLELRGVPLERADVVVRWGPMKKTVPMARGATELEVVLTHRDR